MKAIEIYFCKRMQQLQKIKMIRVHHHQNMLAELQREIDLLRSLLDELRRERLSEAKAKKPLTPAQGRRRAEQDRNRQERIRNIQASAQSRIQAIRAKIGG